MIDIDFIKMKIYRQEDSRKIQEGDCLSPEVIDILKKGKIPDREACFAPSKGRLYYADMSCGYCGKIVKKSLTKRKLLDYLREPKNYLCDDCQQTLDKIKREEEQKSKEEKKQRLHETTMYYIKWYLDPDNSWAKGISGKEKTDTIICVNGDIDSDMVADYISQMDYYDFLATPYWEAISLYKKYLAKYKCQLCSCKGNLRTHHKTYDRHGYEHEMEVLRDDLIVLCDECHKKFHDIVD